MCTKTGWRHSAVIIALIAVAGVAAAQRHTSLKGSVQRIKVHGKGLEGNLDGDSPDRDVSIYLPPGYKKNTAKRYPVVYFLHGYTDDDAKWFGFQKHWINLPRIADSLFAAGGAKELIMVMPNAYTRFQGSFYSNSITTGNWEDFVAKELVSYIDAHYRTLADAKSRGLAGHSMGGYGSMRIGQAHPDVFSSVYLLSPCCLTSYLDILKNEKAIAAVAAVKSDSDFVKSDFTTRIVFAASAAWAPNPKAPPFYIDLPFEGNELKPGVVARWWANAPLAAVDQHIDDLKKLNGFAFDAGTRDEPTATNIRQLDSTLNAYALKHDFEIYEGDHLNRIGERIVQKLLPFFSSHLQFDAAAKQKK